MRWIIVGFSFPKTFERMTTKQILGERIGPVISHQEQWFWGCVLRLIGEAEGTRQDYQFTLKYWAV